MRVLWFILALPCSTKIKALKSTKATLSSTSTRYLIVLYCCRNKLNNSLLDKCSNLIGKFT